MTTLTPRQLEILRMHAEGLTSRDIRKKLFIAENTVKTHNAAIRKKLGAHTMAQAVANAYEAGIIGSPYGRTLLALTGRLADMDRQLDSARAWAVEGQQRADLLAWLLAEEQHHATEHDCCVADLEERNTTLSTLLRGMARRVGEMRREAYQLTCGELCKAIKCIDDDMGEVDDWKLTINYKSTKAIEPRPEVA